MWIAVQSTLSRCRVICYMYSMCICKSHKGEFYTRVHACEMTLHTYGYIERIAWLFSNPFFHFSLCARAHRIACVRAVRHPFAPLHLSTCAPYGNAPGRRHNTPYVRHTHPRCACMHVNGDSCRLRYDYHIRPCMI